MNIKTISNKKILTVDNSTNIFFTSATFNFKSDHDSSLKIYDNLEIKFLNLQNSIDFLFEGNSFTSSPFVMRFDFDMILNIEPELFVFSKNNFTYVLVANNCVFEFDRDENLIVRLSQDNPKISLNYYEDYFVSAKSYYSGVTTVDENTYMPEFSISIFDDNTFTRPRPVRQGVPIVSTVPSFINSSSSSSDENYFDLGKGPDKKTLYFRIICNKVMENISVDAESLMKLKIYMPNGLDTVKNAIYKPMKLYSNNLSKGVSVYYASHDFYLQGNYDGIDYVDGYMYCDVHVPLLVRKSIPFELDYVLY